MQLHQRDESKKVYICEAQMTQNGVAQKPEVTSQLDEGTTRTVYKALLCMFMEVMILKANV